MKLVVVGAGIAGLMAARTALDAGHEVTLFERGRSPGGRLATRRIGDAILDHGAQFFTARDPSFVVLVDEWRAAGVVVEWCRGFAGSSDGYPRYAVRGGMNALAKHVAGDLDVRCNSLVFGIDRRGDGWEVRLDDGSSTAADALVMTCPVPQTASLLTSADVTPPQVLWRTDYERTLALLVVLDGPSAVPAPGGVQASVQADPVWHFVADNAQKGISAVPALTLHANASWSANHWDDDPATAQAALLAAASRWIGTASVVACQVKRWRFATPRSIWSEPCWQPDPTSTLAVGGDAFAGPKVEGAVRSGIAAARAALHLG